MGNNHLDSCGILSQESTYSTNTSLRLQCRWGFHISIARFHAVGNVCPPIPPPLQGYSVTIIKLRPTSKWSLQIWRIIRDLGCGAQPQTLSHPLAMYGPPQAPPPFNPAARSLLRFCAVYQYRTIHFALRQCGKMVVHRKNDGTPWLEPG